MTFASVCTGIGGFDVALERAGHECIWQCEIDRQCREVLKYHWPKVTRYEDILKIPADAARPGILCGGTPCQSFSLAGLRGGMADPRGNLALGFLGLAHRFKSQWVIWENVPGVHSSWSDETHGAPGEAACKIIGEIRGIGRLLDIDEIQTLTTGDFEEVAQSNDFDCFLAGLEKLGYGVATTILDAQYFGLAQRRERVFVVGCLGGDWRRAASVLFDAESLRGDSAPRREPWKGTAPSLAPSLAASGRGTERAGESRGQDCVIPIQEIGKRESGTAMNGVGHGKPGDPMFTLQSTVQHGVCATITKNYASHHGRTSGNNGGVAENQLIACPLTIDPYCDNASQEANLIPEIALALQERDSKGADSSTKVGHLLPIHYAHQYRQDSIYGIDGPANAIACARTRMMQSHFVANAVRRLTPKECERLQGFPDDFTKHAVSEKTGKVYEQADGPRYRQLGNAVAIPCVHWIAMRFK